MSQVSVAQPAPQILNAEAVQQALNTLTYNFNLLAKDVHRHYEDSLLTKQKLESVERSARESASGLTDLYSLIDFLEKNPGADLKDWVQYEAVKERMAKAANMGAQQ